MLITMLLNLPGPVMGQKWPEDVPEAIKFLDNLTTELENIDDLFDSLDDFYQNSVPAGEAYQADESHSSLNTNSQPIIVDSLPELFDEAIYDFRQSLKKDFIKVAGAPDGTISRNQFEAMVQAGIFPLTKESSGS